MDKSDTYIRMCSKATEIQDNHQWAFLDNGYNFQHIFTFISRLAELSPDHRGAIWLPRQDQLQEMIDEKNLSHLAWRFDKFCNPNPSHPYYKDYAIGKKTSFEQLWLAFVMHDKYKKTWNGEEWVKEER